MSERRRYEFSDGKSNKFWEIWRDGAAVRTHYGRMGSSGQTTVKEEADEAQGQKVYDKLVKEKTGKGYMLVTGSGAAPASPPGPSTAAPAPTATAAGRLTGLSTWMATGMTYRGADFDADDSYLFTCTLNPAGDLTVDFRGTAGKGSFVCAADAIQNGSKKIDIAQGGVSLGHGGAADETTPMLGFPPFLLSRSLFAALKAGQKIAWPTVLTGDGTAVEVAKTGTGTRKVRVNGKPEKAKTIEAGGDDVQLVILDDDRWPLILVDEEADECGWFLRAVGKDLEEGSDDDEEGDDDESSDGEEGAASGWRRFEMEEKFWAISLDGSSHTVKFGKIGTDGQEKTKTFDSDAAAKTDYEKLIKEKTHKGYEEAGGDD